MLTKNQIYRARVTGFTSEGLGVCRVDGWAVFVPNAAPDEEYDLQITHIGKSSAWGKIVHIITPSPARVNRDCPWSKQCGGCDFWHLTYEAECEIKRQRVLDALNRLGGQNLKTLKITGAKTCLGYRNKAQFPVGPDKKGLKAGFYQKGTHDIISIDKCLIQPECADQARAIVLNWARQYRVSPYDEKSHTGLLRHIFVRWGAATGQVLVCLVISGQDIPHKRQLITMLKELPGLASVALNINPRKGNAVLGSETKIIWGEDAIEDILCGLRFRISPRSFYQVNRDQAEVLYGKAVKAADLHGTETVLDLYCGTGTITLCMAKQARQVIGVEVIDAAIADAKENARRNGIENARFFCADAGQAAQQLAQEGTRPDVIVVDPPRKGISAEVIDAICEMSPKKVVYVSCDPATLARDVKILCEKGYQMDSAEAVDLFPRCSHVETVVRLSQQMPDDVVRVGIDLDELDLTAAESKATYDEIKAYIKEQTGLSVSSLYIAQVKHKCGLEVGENYNLPKSEDSRQPNCPPEKERAIMDALKHFQMI